MFDSFLENACQENDCLRASIAEMAKKLDDLVYEWIDVSDEEFEDNEGKENLLLRLLK